MRSSPGIIQVGPLSNGKRLYKRRTEGKTRGGGHVTMEAKTGAMQLNSRNVGSHQKLGEARCRPADTSPADCWPRTVSFSVVLATNSVIICYGSNRKLIHPTFLHCSIPSLPSLPAQRYNLVCVWVCACVCVHTEALILQTILEVNAAWKTVSTLSDL